MARKYFAQALRLNNRNMRALFGLYMVSAGLRHQKVGRKEMYTQRVKTLGEKNSSSFGHRGLSRLWRAKEYVNAQLYSDSLCEWMHACAPATVLGNTNGERGSQTGQLTADSDGKLSSEKSVPSVPFISLIIGAFGESLSRLGFEQIKYYRAPDIKVLEISTISCCLISSSGAGANTAGPTFI